MQAQPRLIRLLLLVLTLCTNIACADSQQDATGILQPQQLLQGYPKFAKTYQSYQPTELQLQQMQVLTGKELLVVFGSWCHDSKREVPRMLKLLDESQVQLASLTLLTVDRDKQEPSGVAAANNLKYTPTFIVLEQGKVLARIIEKPQVGIAEDLWQQLAAK